MCLVCGYNDNILLFFPVAVGRGSCCRITALFRQLFCYDSVAVASPTQLLASSNPFSFSTLMPCSDSTNDWKMSDMKQTPTRFTILHDNQSVLMQAACDMVECTHVFAHVTLHHHNQFFCIPFKLIIREQTRKYTHTMWQSQYAHRTSLGIKPQHNTILPCHRSNHILPKAWQTLVPCEVSQTNIM